MITFMREENESPYTRVYINRSYYSGCCRRHANRYFYPCVQDYLKSTQIRRAQAELSAYKASAEVAISEGVSIIPNSDLGMV